MGNDKGYEAMSGLVASLQRALQDLEAGKLTMEGLDEASEQARQLYERLVVLRHKAREARTAAPPPPAPPPRVEPPPMRLSTRPHEGLPGQTSLIDAIAAEEQSVPPAPIEEAQPVAAAAPAPPPEAPPPPPAPKESPKPAEPKPASAKPAPTLASKYDQARGDLHKAIALSQKFWFVSELFQGQRERYERTIDRLNQAADLTAAKAILEEEVVAGAGKAPAADAMATLMDLLERRFR